MGLGAFDILLVCNIPIDKRVDLLKDHSGTSRSCTSVLSFLALCLCQPSFTELICTVPFLNVWLC